MGSKKSKILVTGAAGFIGSAVMATLQADGYHVLGIDNFSSYYHPEMKIQRSRSLSILENISKIDITDFNEISKLIQNFKPTIVIHLAAQGGVRASAQNPRPYLETNQIGFLNIMNAAIASGVEKFLYASSSSVYGEDNLTPFSEDTGKVSAKSLYALSKISNELVAMNVETSKLKIIGLRFFTVYGPWGRPDMAVFRTLASSQLKTRFELTTELDTSRDFTYIDDVVKVISNLVSRNDINASHTTYNVCSSAPGSMNDLIDIITELCPDFEVFKMPVNSYDVKKTHGSTEKLTKYSIPVPNTTLEYGIGNTFDWIRTISDGDIREWYDYRFL